jgi:putative ABC transport system permease protein
MILFRVLFQTVFLALAQILSNWFRSILTTLGIVIGVAAVVLVVAATQGLKTTVLNELESVGANRVWVFPRRPREAPDRFSWRQIRMRNREALGMKAACPSLRVLTPIKGITMPVEFGDRKEPNVSIQGIWPEWHDIEGRQVLQGRPFLRVDEDERRLVCLVNDKAIEELVLPKDPVGQSVLVDGRRFLIVGVVETKSVAAMFGGGESRTEVFIPFSTADLLRPEPLSGLYIAAKTFTPEQFEDARAEIKFYMRNMRGLTPDDPDTFGVESIEQAKEQVGKVAGYITAGASVIVGISLIVGGIGIMNIMLVSVSERTREIGLRKAMGAQPALVLTQFLAEAVVLCLVGAAVGLGFSLAAIFVLTAQSAKDSFFSNLSVPMWSVYLAAGCSAFTGVVAGMFPAIKAARLDPIVALRHE